MQKTILRQLQDEIREREWSMADLALQVRRRTGRDIERTLMWRKLLNTEGRVRLDVAEVEDVVKALRTRNREFTITYPTRRAAA